MDRRVEDILSAHVRVRSALMAEPSTANAGQRTVKPPSITRFAPDTNEPSSDAR